jgi:V8-like Glu-specific endopeptidase
MANFNEGDVSYASPLSSGRSTLDDTNDFGSQTSAPLDSRRAAPPAVSRLDTKPPAESQFAVGEVAGDSSTTAGESSQAGMHEEVASSGGTESGEEFVEASAEQMAEASASHESAVSDLRNIEGFEEREVSQESEESVSLEEAGAVAEGGSAGQQEFLPILAALVPTLVSTIGPMVAKAVLPRLSPKAQRVIKRLPIGNIVQGAGAIGGMGAGGSFSGVAAGILKGTGGAGNASSLLALIAKLINSAQQTPRTGKESSMEIDESFVTEAVAAIEAIVDRDDRVQITQTSQIPWRRLCALRIQFPSGSSFRGTGFLVGPRAVVTAGHCVFLRNQGGWARKVEVIPGCNGTSRPFGQVESTSLRSVGGWVTGGKPESDYGCVVLPAGAFDNKNLGSFGFAAFEAPVLLAQPAVIVGFPGDKPPYEMWGAARALKGVTAKTLLYNTATMGGQSGAPVYIKRSGQRFVVGIHNYGASTGNTATRITRPVYERLLAWSKL